MTVILAISCITWAPLGACGDDGKADEAGPSTSQAPARGSRAPAKPAPTPAENAAAELAENYRTLRLSFARTPAERRELAKAIDSYVTKQADCSPTARKQVFNCSMRLASRGYAPNIEQYRFIIMRDSYRMIPQ